MPITELESLSLIIQQKKGSDRFFDNAPVGTIFFTDRGLQVDRTSIVLMFRQVTTSIIFVTEAERFACEG